MYSIFIAAGIIFVAAPGDREPLIDDVPALAEAAVARRLQAPPTGFQIKSVSPSSRMPGFVVCGSIHGQTFLQNGEAHPERFFVIVPGDFAVLERDGQALLEKYWSLNHC